MTALVTGASGFVGAAVLRALQKRGRKVRVLVEPGADTRNLEAFEVERFEGDVTDAKAVGRAIEGCESLYHLAAIYKIWMPDPEPIYRVNLEGTTTTLLAAQAARVKRVVYTSSIAGVGFAERDGQPADETRPFNGWKVANDYVITKHLSERIALSFARAGLPIVVVNPAFPFGPGDVAPTPTGQIIADYLNGRLPAVGPGGFCAIDVDDVGEGHVLAEERGKIGERYILGNHNVSFPEFFRQIGEVAGISRPLRTIPGPLFKGIAFALEAVADRVTHRRPLTTYKSALYTTRHLYFDNAKARRELGLPVTPLRDTIERAVRWFREAGVVTKSPPAR
jgi:dihydroflavonol-4-reductase